MSECTHVYSPGIRKIIGAERDTSDLYLTFRIFAHYGNKPQTLPSFIKHYIGISGKVLRKKDYPFSKARVLLQYYTLILKSFLHLRFNQSSDAETFRTSILGFKIQFSHYPTLVNLFEEIFIENIYFFKASSDEPLIIDCGSNIGMSLLYFKILYPKSQIIAFEPDTEIFPMLKQNVVSNGFTHVTLHPCALGNQEGKLPIYRPLNRKGSLNTSLFKPDTAHASETITITRLSVYVSGRIDFVKIDVEGAEGKIIEDLADTNKLALINQVVIEYHPEQMNHPPDLLITKMNESGFLSEVRRVENHEPMLFFWQR